MQIDPKKTYKTRDGREVRIYAVDGMGTNPVHGAIKSNYGFVAAQWFPHGGFLSDKDDPRDLIEVRPRIKREMWVNVYPGENTHWVMHLTKESADRLSMPNRIACVKLTIDCVEGEGLSNGYCEYGKDLSNG